MKIKISLNGKPLELEPALVVVPLELAPWWARTWARAATLELTVYPFTLRAQRRHERRAAEHLERARRRELELKRASAPIEATITIERAR